MGFYSPAALLGACANMATKLTPIVVFTALVVVAAQDAKPPLVVRYQIAMEKQAAGLKLKFHDKLAVWEERMICPITSHPRRCLERL